MRLIKTLILLALGAFVYNLILNGNIDLYIHPRFISLSLLAALGLLLVGLSYFRPIRKGEESHIHEHSSVGWIGFLILLVPVLLGWLVPQRPLGASAMTTRDVNIGTFTSVASPGSNTTSFNVTETGQRNILDWLIAFQSSGAEQFVGEDVRLIGFVFRDERFADDSFMLSRFVVSCCTADGTPIGLIVEGENLTEFEADSWVEVAGVVEIGTFDGIEMGIVRADSIRRVEIPEQPYLYP